MLATSWNGLTKRSVSVSIHTPPTPTLQATYTPAVLGMYLSHYSSQWLAPLSLLLSPGHQKQYRLDTCFSVYTLTACFPTEALRDTWTWKGVISGVPALVPMKVRAQTLPNIQAQRSCDLNRTLRPDPSIWEDTTMSFAAKVLDLSLLTPSRSTGL